MLSLSLSVWANPSVLPYLRTFPINTRTLGRGELSPASQPLRSQLGADHRSQGCYITTSPLGNLFPAGVCGDEDRLVSYRYSQLWSSQALLYSAAGPTLGREAW